MLKLKVGENLHISGDKVISYDTVVAKISGDSLIELGRFSRTTTKHISKVAEVFGFKIVSNKTKQLFWRYDFGVKINLESALSTKTAVKIGELVKEGVSIENSIYLVDLTQIPKKDREEIEYLLSKKGINSDKISALKSWYSMRNMV